MGGKLFTYLCMSINTSYAFTAWNPNDPGFDWSFGLVLEVFFGQKQCTNRFPGVNLNIYRHSVLNWGDLGFVNLAIWPHILGKSRSVKYNDAPR